MSNIRQDAWTARKLRCHQIMFKFYRDNHSVIESLYRWPCVPKEAINGEPGFFSGTSRNKVAVLALLFQANVKNPEFKPVGNESKVSSNNRWKLCQ